MNAHARIIYHEVVRRIALPLLLAAAGSACVSVEAPPDPVGIYHPGQRLVVFVYQAPGPWIVSDTDSKLEAAAQITPLGFAMAALQSNHTLAVSKAIEQYLPRPRYDEEFQNALLAELSLHMSSAPLQTGLEAGITPEQIQRWNRAKDQLDWRAAYFVSDPSLPPPRDYSRAYGFDDALVLDVNLNYGTTATDDGKLQPDMAASWRVYRGLNGREVWEHADEMVDQTSSSTLVDIQSNPTDLPARLELLAPKLGQAVGHEFARAFGLLASTAPVHPSLLPETSSGAVAGAPSAAPAASAAAAAALAKTLASPPSGPMNNGLLPLDVLLKLASQPADAAAAAPAMSTATAPSPATAPPAPTP